MRFWDKIPRSRAGAAPQQFCSARSLILGLAVLAHEFGHFDRGRMILGARLYRARLSMIRVIDALSAIDSLLLLPYYAYSLLFLHLTQSIFRHHELAADNLSAELAGPDSAAATLTAINAAGLEIDAYIEGVMPVLRAGYHPPFLEGFHKFCSDPSVARRIEKGMRRVHKRPAESFDTHPSLAERLSNLAEFPRKEIPVADPPAISLIEDLTSIEHSILETFFAIKRERVLKPIAWEQVIPIIYVPAWKQHHAQHGRSLKGMTPMRFPEFARDITEFGASLWPRKALKRGTITGEQAREHAYTTVGAALTFGLVKRGWEFDPFQPGRAVRMRKEGNVVEPFAALHDLVRSDEKKLSPEGWQKKCVAFGIADLDLGEPFEADQA